MLPTIRKVTLIQKIEFSGSLNFPEKFNFRKDLDELRNSRIWGLEAYYDFGTPASTNGTLKEDPNFGLELITKKQYQGAFLNLYDVKNVNFLINCPLAVFGTIQNNDNANLAAAIVERDNKSFSGQKIDIQNSFIIFEKSSLPAKAEVRTVVLDIYYSRIDLDQVIIQKLK